MANSNEKGTKITLEEMADTNYMLVKEATVFSRQEGNETDFVILYEYRRKGGEHFSDMITLNQEQIEKIATALGYVKEDFDYRLRETRNEISQLDD